MINNENVLETFIERYETHESCQQLNLEFVYYYFYGCYPNKNFVIKCKTLYDTYKFLKKSKLNFVFKCNLLFLLNPLYAYIFIKSIIKKNRFYTNSKIILLHFSSAHEFYNIEDIWNHYICEFNLDNKWLIYDSYYKNIKFDYKDMIIKPITHDSLKNIKKITFIIWR